MTVMNVASLVIAVGSAYVQQRKAKKARKAAKERRGFEVVTEGEIENVPVIYGRTKRGGTRVFHKVSKSYTYIPSWASTTEVFLSSGGDEPELSKSLFVVVSNGFSMTYTGPPGSDPNTIGAFDAGLIVKNPVPVDWVLTLNSANNTYSGNVGSGNASKYNVGGAVTLTSDPLIVAREGRFFDADGVEINPASYTATYTVVSYENGTGLLTLAPPATVVNGYTVIDSNGNDSLSYSVNTNHDNTMFISQVLCMDEISEVHFVDVDGRPYYDPHFLDKSRIHIHKKGGLVEPQMAAEFSNAADDKSNAKFPDVVRAEMYFAIDRKKPQFSSVPRVQFYVEGKLIKHDFTGLGDGGATFGYSNNAAAVLLDYMLDTRYGQGVAPAKIHFASFAEAERVCNEIMQTYTETYELVDELPIEGKLWGAKVAKDSFTVRNIKRYEFNGGIDTQEKVRDNIRTILQVMDQAVLVWSGGQYKLNLIYPYSWLFRADPNTEPGAQFDYKEDQIVQYTPGKTPTEPGPKPHYVDIYRARFDMADASSNLPASINAQGKLVVNTAAWTVASVAVFTDDDIILDGEVVQNWPNLNDRLNYCTIRYLNEALDFEEDTIGWPPKYSQDNPVYDTYFTCDNNLLLESEEFINGITDRYHARAYAEELVRASRSEGNLRIVVGRRWLAIEPGDIIKIESNQLGIPGELVKIGEVRVLKSGNIEMLCTKFDANFLAWNAPDNQVVEPRNVYFNTALGQAWNLQFVPVVDMPDWDGGIIAGEVNKDDLGKIGTLVWNEAPGIGDKFYVVKYIAGPAGK